MVEQNTDDSAMNLKSSGPVVLCIMDGWGHNRQSANNAVALADTPGFDALCQKWPVSLLAACGADVGLPDGQVGNSEVGHMNIGAGRIVMQNLPRINAAMKDGSLTQHPDLLALAKKLHGTGGRIHVMGLLSPGGVHAHQDQMLAVIKGLCDAGADVIIHGFSDGRDVLPKSAATTLPEFTAQLADGAQFGTLIGRFYAMDRDNRWERTATAFDAICHAKSANPPVASPEAAIDEAYAAGENDEFITPRIMASYDGMRDGDAVVMVNFRADRVRQILAAWLFPDEVGFNANPVQLTGVIGMTSYSSALDAKMTTLFAPQKLTDMLGSVVADAGKRQLRLAETEKYPHVTFFLNGGNESVATGEDREMVPSPKVSTYDLQPEMSANAILEIALDSINANKHDLLVINFANPDMVGHTGNLDAAIAAVASVDGCVARLAAAVLAASGQMLLTADHGNCEVMWDDVAKSPHTAHTINPVPCVLIGGPVGVKIADGRLGDLGASLLAMLGVAQPTAMTGQMLQRANTD